MNRFRLWAVAALGLIPLYPLVSQELAPTAEDTVLGNSPSWTLFRLKPEEFLRLPGRGIEYYLPLLPGVVEFKKDLHVRGSRSYENVYVLNGINVTNPVTNNNGFELIPEATERIDVHTGPTGAGQYSANGGLIASHMRVGGDRLEAFAEYRTDDVVKAGGEFFGTVPLGVKNIVATVGGPAIDGLHFFFAGQYRYLRNDQAIFLEPFRYEGLTDDGFYGGSATRGRLLPAMNPADSGIVDFKRNFISKNWFEKFDLNGNIALDLRSLTKVPLDMKFWGLYVQSQQPFGMAYPPFSSTPAASDGAGWPGALTNFFRPEDRLYRNETANWLIGGSVRYAIDSRTSATLALAYQARFSETFDPRFGHSSFADYLEIADSAANAAKGVNTSEWRSRYAGPSLYSTIWGFTFTHPHAPNNAYAKDEQTGISSTIDISSRVTDEWGIHAGARYASWTLRQYGFNNIRNLLWYIDPNTDGNFSDSPIPATEYEKRVRYIDRGQIVNWGYDYLGNKTDGYTLDGSSATLDKPYEPVFASAYAEATYRKNGTALSFGLCYEFIEPSVKTVSGTTASGQPDFTFIPYDYTIGMMDEAVITTTDPFHLLLPRVSLAAGIGTKATFHAAVGRYAQMPPYELLMQSNFQFSQSVSPPDRSPYTFGRTNIAFPVKPEQLMYYEAGGTVVIVPNLSLEGTLYYKSMKDQLQMARYYDEYGRWILSVRANEGYGTAKGVEVSFRLHRTKGLAVQLGYALSAAKGLTSNPLSNVVWVTDAYMEDTVLVARPFDYQQLHRATLLADFRTTSAEGPIWGDITAMAVLTFNSGHPFTKEDPMQNMGSSSPWNVGVRTLIDPRTASHYQDEPTNSSETPSVFNIDIRVSKGFTIGPIHAEVFLAILNVLDTKNVVNVYPATGTATSDGWYEASPYYQFYESIPLYSSFYKDININNRWAYTGATGNDLYGSPRQFQIGLSVRY